MNKLSEALPNFGSSVSQILAQENFVTVSTLISRRLLSTHTSFRGQGLEKEPFLDLDMSSQGVPGDGEGMIGVQIPPLSYFLDFLSVFFPFESCPKLSPTYSRMFCSPWSDPNIMRMYSQVGHGSVL